MDALSFNPTAHANNVADSDITFGTVNLVDVDLGSPKATTSHTVEAYFGPKEGDGGKRGARRARSPSRKAACTLTAETDSDASVNEVDVELSVGGYSSIDPTVEVGGATQAYLGGNFTFDADFVHAHADAHNLADSDSIQLALNLADIDFSKRSADGPPHHRELHSRRRGHLCRQRRADPRRGCQQPRAIGRRGDRVRRRRHRHPAGDGHSERLDLGIRRRRAPRSSRTSLVGRRRTRTTTPRPTPSRSATRSEASARAKAEALIEHTTQAFIGESRTDGVAGIIDVGEGNVTVEATSRNNAEIDDIDVGLASIDVDLVRPKVDVKGATLAFLGAAYVIQAGAVGVRADSTNTASSNAINIEGSDAFALGHPEDEHHHRSHDRGVRRGSTRESRCSAAG